jgi:hypothetical protein
LGNNNSSILEIKNIIPKYIILRSIFYCTELKIFVATNLVYRVLVGRPDGKRPLGRPWRRLEDNIKMDLQEVGWEGMDWIYLA